MAKTLINGKRRYRNDEETWSMKRQTYSEDAENPGWIDVEMVLTIMPISINYYINKETDQSYVRMEYYDKGKKEIRDFDDFSKIIDFIKRTGKNVGYGGYWKESLSLLEREAITKEFFPPGISCNGKVYKYLDENEDEYFEPIYDEDKIKKGKEQLKKHEQISNIKDKKKFRSIMKWGIISPFFFAIKCDEERADDDMIPYLFLTGQARVGKALKLDTPILTTKKWTTIGKLKAGEKVFDENGNICNVIGKSEIFKNHKCYNIKFSNGEEIIADEDHLWSVKSETQRNKSFINSKYEKYQKIWTDEYKSGLSYKKIGEKYKVSKTTVIKIINKDKNNKNEIKTTKELLEKVYGEDGRSWWSIDTPMPLKRKNKKLQISPYMLGLWIGDGDSHKPQLTMDEKDFEKIYHYIEKDGYKIITKKRNSENSHTYRISQEFKEGEKPLRANNKFRQDLINLNLINNKHIPKEYMNSSFEQKLDFIKGIMDTDGTIDKRNGRCTFTQKNKDIIYSVTEILRSIGINVKNPIKKVAKISGKEKEYPYYEIGFMTTLPVFNLPRKLKYIKKELKNGSRIYIKSIKEVPSVPVQCIAVDSPNNLFLCGKSMIPTHNTALLNIIAKIYEVKQKSSQSIKTQYTMMRSFGESKYPLIIEESHSIFISSQKDAFIDTLKANASSTKEVGARGLQSQEVKEYIGMRTMASSMNFDPSVTDSGMRRRMINIIFVPDDIVTEESKEEYTKLKNDNYIKNLKELFFYLQMQIIDELNNTNDHFIDCVNKVLKKEGLNDYIDDIIWITDVEEATKREEELIEEEAYSFINSELSKNSHNNDFLLKSGYIPGIRYFEKKDTYLATSTFIEWYNNKTQRFKISLRKFSKIINEDNNPKATRFGKKVIRTVELDKNEIYGLDIDEEDEDLYAEYKEE